MTDLRHLKVSLTKHNAHKVAFLLKKYDAEEVFNRIGEVKAEAAQTRKNLSTGIGDVLPPVWKQAQQLGPDAIDALVLIAIIFSHYDLINAMANATGRRDFSGTIEYDKQPDGKAASNFARIVDQLGYATRIERGKSVTFDLRGVFEVPGLGPVAAELLTLKLISARWDQSNSVANEAVKLELNKVFGISAANFKEWLELGAQPANAASDLLVKDEEFFQDNSEGMQPTEFHFVPGHDKREVEPVSRITSARSTAKRLHNDIQNKLFEHLKAELGLRSVGTENATGYGTSIDLVTIHAGVTTFYEIKTGSSVRTSIRQAIPQLLEYAHWPEAKRADSLVIVSHLPVTPFARKYIKFLRNTFGIPLSYRQFDLEKNTLI